MTKAERKLFNINKKIKSLMDEKEDVEEEVKEEHDAKKKLLLDRHHISVEELRRMIKDKEAEDKKILDEYKNNKSLAL